MATAHQIRDLITETTTGTVRPPRPARGARRGVPLRSAPPREGAPWAVIARETGLDVRKLQRWNVREPGAAAGAGAAPGRGAARPGAQRRGR